MKKFTLLLLVLLLGSCTRLQKGSQPVKQPLDTSQLGMRSLERHVGYGGYSLKILLPKEATIFYEEIQDFMSVDISYHEEGFDYASVEAKKTDKYFSFSIWDYGHASVEQTTEKYCEKPLDKIEFERFSIKGTSGNTYPGILTKGNSCASTWPSFIQTNNKTFIIGRDPTAWGWGREMSDYIIKHIVVIDQ